MVAISGNGGARRPAKGYHGAGSGEKRKAE
jgi:hypothetical protein